MQGRTTGEVGKVGFDQWWKADTVRKQFGTSLLPEAAAHQQSPMRLAVSLPVSRISDRSTVSQKNDFYKCCLTRNSIKPDVQNPLKNSLSFNATLAKNCRTVWTKYFADAMFLQVIDLEDPNHLDYSAISGNTASRSDHVTDIVCLADDNERLRFRLQTNVRS